MIVSKMCITCQSLFTNTLVDHEYRAANAIFDRIGRIACEEVIIQLIKSKCIPVLVYGLEVCPLTKSDL